MRTAKEIITDTSNLSEWAMSQTDCNEFHISVADAIKAINEARIEAIKECASVAEFEVLSTNEPTSEDVSLPILKLIDQIK